MNPPSIILGGGVHGKTCWLIAYKDLHWLPIRQRITFKILLLTYQAYHNTAPDYLCELITPYCNARNLRSKI